MNNNSPYNIVQQMQTPQQNDREKKYKIVLAITSSLAIISLASAIFVVLTNNRNGGNQGDGQSDKKGNNTQVDISDICNNRPAFEDLTKEAAIAYIREQQKNPTCGMNEILANKKLLDIDPKYKSDLLYSYADPSEILKIANDDYMFSLNFDASTDETTKYSVIEGDHYAIIKHETPSHSLGISFDKNYLNYEKTYDGIRGIADTYDELTFTNREKDWVEKAMSIVVMASRNSTAIYDYEFKEEDNSYVYILKNIGIGVDESSLANYDPNSSNFQYQLTFYTNKFTIDKNTGRCSQIKHSNGTGYKEKLRSFDISEEDLKTIYRQSN